MFIVIHGWTENVFRAWVQNVLSELWQTFQWNVCGVDWSTLAVKDLLTAEGNTRSVGKYVAQFIAYLDVLGISFEYVTVIGHSLGAQVSAYCGEYLNGTLGSIIGMDMSLTHNLSCSSN